ncbi:tyrosine-type recombinase/integrase [Variovorax rhizosphaerae]|uniref:Integrase arm-type DNA-binding domain-containing protein n=1 Tax=Variovorax rhizosphaerae TaxID=1836200 RepID=A0ABU8WT18_9BURK
MGRGIEKLSDGEIKKAIKGPDALIGDGGGLWLQIRGENGASWIFRYERAGKMRSLGVGPLHTIDVTAARAKAKEHRLALHEGRDPAEERVALKRTAVSRAAGTAAAGKPFRQIASEYIELMAPGWKEKLVKRALAGGKEPPKKGSENQWRQSLGDYAYPIIGDMLPGEITTADVERVLVQKVKGKDGYDTTLWLGKNETADRVRGRIANILGAAMAKGLCPTVPNPAAWKDNFEHILPAPGDLKKTKPMESIDWVDLPATLDLIRARPGQGARALEMSILTVSRSDQLLMMKWDDLHDLGGALPYWLAEGEDTKNGLGHIVPLGSRALEIIRGQEKHDGCPYVFASQLRRDAPFTALSENAMRAVIDECGLRNKKGNKPTQHGLARACFRTWVHESTEFAREVCELIMAHTVGDKAERTYVRGPAMMRRRRVLDAWTRFCNGDPAVDELVTPPDAQPSATIAVPKRTRVAKATRVAEAA